MERLTAPCIRCEAGRRQQKRCLERPGCALARAAAARLWHSLHVHLVPQVSPGSWPSCQYQAPGVPVPCCDCRGILSASKTRAGQYIWSVAETISFTMETAYCNDHIIQVIAWEKAKQTMQTSIQKSLRVWHAAVALYRNQSSGFSFLC